jgi:hypothetical protein
VGPKKPAELKSVAKTFYKQMVVDSEYQGEDYEVFSNWLGEWEQVIVSCHMFIIT